MYSQEHLVFLKNIRKRKIYVTFVQILVLLSFLIAWELLAKYELINTFLYSSPSRIFNTIVNLFMNNDLIGHINITIYETIISFLIASLLGFLVASILWWNKFISDVVDPYLTVLNSLPKVALGPLIIVWVGASTRSIIIMALLISAFISIINIYNGFMSVNSNYILLMKSMNASKFQIFFKVVLPSNLNNIISSFKINISMSLIGLLPPVGEKIFFNKCYSRY